MRLDELQKEWDADSYINPTDLGGESIRNPKLYSKYLNKLSNCRLLVRKAESDALLLRNKKFRYYRGEMTKAELLANGWHQYQGTKPLKSEMDEFLNSDPDIVKVTDKVEYLRVMQSFLEGVIKSLGSRTWDIKSAVEWHKIQNGII